MSAPDAHAFEHHGAHFSLDVTENDNGLFAFRVRYLDGLRGIQPTTLPEDAAPYGSAAEALRHAEQQAVRWMNDLTGDGQGRF